MMNTRSAIIVVSTFLFFYIGTANAEEKSFEERLNNIEARRKSVKPGALEKQFLGLIGESASSSRKGRVYTAIGRTYRRNYLKHFREVIKYSRLALKEDIGTLARVDMEIAQGNALQSEWQAGKKELLKDVRARLVKPQLRALRAIGDKLILRKGGDGAGMKEFVAGFGKEKKPDMGLQNDLMIRKKRAIRGCVLLYVEEPYDTEGLRGLAVEILTEKNVDIVDELMAKVETSIKWREDQIKKRKKSGEESPVK